jgi:hypothetical protein
MPWQRDAAMVGCEINPATGLPAYREVIVTVPRQQGKTTLYLTWQIDRCTSPRWEQPQRSAFTAQSGKDARDKWLDEIFPLMRRSRLFRPRGPLVSRIYEGMGNEYIRFNNGSLIRLLSTSTSSGHSKTLQQAVLDEVWHDTDGRREQGLRPAMLTVRDAQLLVCSTAGTATSVVLNRKVEAGRAAAEADTGTGICYVEYSAPDGWDPADEESYSGFMPALCPDPPCRCGEGAWRHSVTLDVIRGERLSGMEPAEFARAYGNIPDRSGQAVALTDFSGWAGLADRESKITGRLGLAVAVSPDGTSSSIAVAGRRADGAAHGELTEPPRAGTQGLVARLLDLWDSHNPCVLVLNAAGEALALQREIEEHGFSTRPDPGERQLQVVGPREYAQACGALGQDVVNGRWRHLGQGPLDKAVSVARVKPLGDAWVWCWSRSRGDIGPLEAVTLARHGFMSFGVGADQVFGSWR